MSDTAETKANRLTWVGSGQLASALGVSDETSARIDDMVDRHHKANSNLRAVFEELDTLDLNDNEWTAATYALGYWRGAVER